MSASKSFKHVGATSFLSDHASVGGAFSWWHANFSRLFIDLWEVCYSVGSTPCWQHVNWQLCTHTRYKNKYPELNVLTYYYDWHKIKHCLHSKGNKHESNMPSVSEIYNSLFHIHHHTESSTEGRDRFFFLSPVKLHQKMRWGKGGSGKEIADLSVIPVYKKKKYRLFTILIQDTNWRFSSLIIPFTTAKSSTAKSTC